MTGMANEIDEAFVARLRVLVARAGSASALVKRAGISTSGFHKYLAGAEPTRRVLIALAQAGGVQLEWLTTGAGAMEAAPRDAWPDNHLTLLPLYCDLDPAQAEAAPLSDAQQDKLVQLAFCREWLAKHGFDPAHLATIRVAGDGMAPTFRHGDTLVVDTHRETVTDGEIYVVRDNGALFIKRLQRGLGGRVTLLSDNPRYPALEAELGQLDIVGNVIWRGALL
ncbi:MAG: LexA family transcriptional regulator [Burkholderia gladioli]